MHKYSYDDFSDSLLVSAKKADDKVAGSLIYGDVVVDLTSEGKVVGVEVRHFSSYLNEVRKDLKIDSLQEATLAVKYRHDGFSMVVYLKFENIEERIQLPIYALPAAPIIKNLA